MLEGNRMKIFLGLVLAFSFCGSLHSTTNDGAPPPSPSLEMNNQNGLPLTKSEQELAAEFKPIKTPTSDVKVEYLVIRKNKEFELLKANHTLHVIKGDVLVITDILGKIPNKKALTVNFVGYRGGNKKNLEEDRQLPIHTDTDLVEKFAMNKEKDLYQIYIKSKNAKVAYFYIKILPPQFGYLLLQRNKGNKIALYGKESIKLKRSDTIKILDIKTNIQNNLGVKLRVKLLSGDLGQVPLVTIQKVGEEKTVIGTRSAHSPNSRPVDMVFEILRNDRVFGSVSVSVK